MNGRLARAINLIIAIFGIAVICVFHLLGSRIAFESGVFLSVAVIVINHFMIVD